MTTRPKSHDIEKLRDDNFLRWRFEMTNLLRSKGLWKYCQYPFGKSTTISTTPSSTKTLKTTQRTDVQDYSFDDAVDEEDDDEGSKGKEAIQKTTITPPTSTQHQNDIEYDQKALGKISLNVTEKFYDLIYDSDNAFSAWNAISKYFSVLKASTKLALKLEFYRMQQKKGESLSDYMDRVKDNWDQLRAIGDKTPEADVCYKIVATIRIQYDNIATTFFNTPENQLELDTLKACFKLTDTRENQRMIEWKERKEHESAPSITSLTAVTNIKKCNYCRRKGHVEEVCRFKKRDEKEEEEEKATANTTWSNAEEGPRVFTYSL